MDEMPKNVRVLRFFGGEDAVRTAALTVLADGTQLKTQEMRKGGEVLVLLQANAADDSADKALLDSAEARLHRAVGADLYGTDAVTLPQAAVAALQKADRLFVAADGATGARLHERLKGLPEAAAVYDFGSQSYTHARFGPKIAEGGAAGRRAGGDIVLLAQGRIREACRLSGADYAVTCIPCNPGRIVMAGSAKGFWRRALPEGENPALWLLDMLRRAALGAPQAPGTVWQNYGAEPAEDAPAAAAVFPAGQAARPAAAPAIPDPASSPTAGLAAEAARILYPNSADAPAVPAAGAFRHSRPARAAEAAEAGSARMPQEAAPGAEKSGAPADTAPTDMPAAAQPPVFAALASPVFAVPASPVPAPAAPAPEAPAGPQRPETPARQAQQAMETPLRPEQPDSDPAGMPQPPRRRGGLGGLLIGLLIAALGAAIVLAAVWFLSGGDLAGFWQRSGLRQFNLSGASLL
jgi:hypothetical protein